MAQTEQRAGAGARMVETRLREELQGILTALDRWEAADGQTQAQAVRGGCYRLLRDAANLALYTRPAAPLARVELTETLGRLLAAAGAVLEQAGRRLQPSLPEGPVFLLCDRGLLLGGVLNLLSNSGQFTPPGGKVALCCRVQEGRLRLTVTDQGCGMAPAVLQQATAPYFSWAEGAPAGLGLGLAVARRAASLHRGRLTLTAAPGKGCVAALTLPLRDGPGPLLPAQTARELLSDRYSPLWVLLSNCCQPPWR